MNLLKKLIFLCVYFSFTSFLYADYTYLTYDKLIFGNGGGFELAEEDGDNYLRVLNISGSEESYESKGFSVEGKLMSIIPATPNTYIENDNMLMATAATFTDGVIPSFNTTSTLPEDQIFFVGEYLGNFMLLNEDTITGYTLVPNAGYTKAPIYLQQDNGALFMGKNSLNTPVLSIYPSINNTAYMGINRADPIEAVTVSGNLKVENGTILMENPFGIATVQYAETNALEFNGVASDVLVSDRTVDLNGYVSANVIAFGQLTSFNTSFGTWMTAYLKVYYLSGSSWIEYDNPLYPGTSVETSSRRDTDGDAGLSAFPLYPFTCIQLDPDLSTGVRTYKFELWAISGGSLYYDTDQGHIYVFGLPSGSYANVSVSSPVTTGESTELFSSALLELDGNYLTDQLLSFGSGGGIAESGQNIIFTNGDSFLDFKASSLSFGEYHNIDSIKVINNSTDYPFQLGVDASNLGMDSNIPLYDGSLVSQNIQTLTTSKGPSSIDLNILSDIYIGDSISILTNGTVSPNVEIGAVDTDTSIALNVSGNLLFTGSLDGDLIKIFYKAVTLSSTTKYSDEYFKYGHLADISDDILQFSLDPTIQWNLIFFVNASFKLRDSGNESWLSMWINRTNPAGETGGYKTSLYVDNDVIDTGNFFNLWYVTWGGGDMSMYLNMEAKRFQSSIKSGIQVDFSDDDSYSGSNTIDIEEYGGYMGVIAIPAGAL